MKTKTNKQKIIENIPKQNTMKHKDHKNESRAKCNVEKLTLRNNY